MYIVYLLYNLFTYLLSNLFTSLRIGPFRFHAWSRKRQPNLALVFFVFILCYSIFCNGCMFAFLVLDLVFHY